MLMRQDRPVNPCPGDMAGAQNRQKYHLKRESLLPTGLSTLSRSGTPRPCPALHGTFLRRKERPCEREEVKRVHNPKKRIQTNPELIALSS